MNKSLVLKRRLMAESIRIRTSSELRRSQSVKSMGIDQVGLKIATVLNPGFWNMQLTTETHEKFKEKRKEPVDKCFFHKKDNIVAHFDVHTRQKCAFDRTYYIVRKGKILR